MVDSEKERKGGKGTRQWANWGLSIMFVLFPFALPLKEREAGKKIYWTAVTFCYYYMPYYPLSIQHL